MSRSAFVQPLAAYMSWFSEFLTETFRKCQNSKKGLADHLFEYVWVEIQGPKITCFDHGWVCEAFGNVKKLEVTPMARTAQIIPLPLLPLWPMAVRGNQLSPVATIWASSRLFPKWSFLWSSPTSCQPPPTDCPKPSGRSCRGLWPLDSSREPGSRPETRILKFSDCPWVALDPPKCFRSTWILMKCAAGLDHHHEAALTVYGQAQRSQCRPAEGPLGNKAIN